MSEVLAIIPARGGSKGIPGKNLRVLAGRPLLVHSIEQARNARRVSRVIVSTDDRRIAEVALRSQAEVVMRPVELAADDSPSEAALTHALDHLRVSEGYEPALVVFLQPTSPIRSARDIDGAVDALRAANADSLFSASPQHGFVWRLGEHEPVSVTYDFRSRPHRQQAPVHVAENGSIYVFRPESLRKHGNRLGGRIATFLMGSREALQIDDPDDLEVAETLLANAGSTPASTDLSGIRLLLLDFDGVLTDNRVVVRQDGTESVLCHRGDGWGIGLLRELDVEVIVVSTEENPVVGARCRKLKVPCVQGCRDKGDAVAKLVAERRLSLSEVAYVANDLNDLECLGQVGFPIAVADAVPEIRSRACYVTRARGGHGAVREVCDLIVKGRKSAQ